jgi:hypothetical protein
MAGFDFPFAVAPTGSVTTSLDDDANLRAQIIQVLFTTPGERVNQPEFGCGLFNLVFDPANSVLFAAVEFTAGQALTRWLGDRLVVLAVDVAAEAESLSVRVDYLRRSDLATQSVRIRFA